MSGLFGVVSKTDCIDTLLFGTDYHSHLGTEYGGLAVLGETFVRRIHNISQSQFKSKFYEDLSSLKGNKGIGVISALEEQPIFLKSKVGSFCIATNGRIENTQQLAEDLMRQGNSFSEMKGDGVNASELIARIVAQGETLLDGIEQVFEKIKGSCTMLILSEDGIYAARDRYGYSPLVIGRRGSGWAVTTETTAFPNNGFEVVKVLGPGEIVLLSEQGLQTVRPAGECTQICSFLWIYTGFPASDYEGVNTEIVRERSGAKLARRDQGLEIDQVCGVPDSGTTHAIGYAMESGKPFRRPLVKYTPGYGRSYTPPSQASRDLVATMKLVSVQKVAEAQRIVVCDDSIVRGTQLKNFTIDKLKKAGAKEIHVRIACPPLMFPCRFNLSTRTTQELAARRAIRALEGQDVEDVSAYLDPSHPKYQAMVNWIANDLSVSSLKYQTAEDMVSAIGVPREKLCLYCWTGQCPTPDRTPTSSRREEVLEV